MKLDAIATCILIGACGHVLTRVPSILFPDDIEIKESEHTEETNPYFQKVYLFLQNINLARRSVRNHLSQWNVSNNTWHFLSTSVKDNLGFVLFFLSLADKSFKVPCPRDPQTIPLNKLTPTEEDEKSLTNKQEAIVSQTLAAKRYLEYSRSSRTEVILSTALIVIISCGMMHLARNTIYTFGNRMLNKYNQSHPNIIAIQAVLARIAPSDRY